ncbi:B12-binding domain-containing radical SAM protein [Acidobacteriota bacterium]
MKSVLINPPITPEQVFGDWDLSDLDTYCPPLGLLYIAGYLRQFGHTVHIIDTIPLKWTLEELVQNVSLLDPDVIGISSTTVNIVNANRIAEKLKTNGLKAPIILGGPHVSALPKLTLERYCAFDYGVLGEGEMSYLELIQTIEKKEPISSVKGIAWRDNSGDIIVNPIRPLIEDLDILPLPAWDLLPNFPDAYPHNALETKRLPAATILTSRGCPFQCTFCDRSVFGNSVREHSVEYTIKMIQYLKHEHGIKDLMVVDDNFLLKKQRLFQICDAMIDNKMNLSWYCLGHVKYMTEDRLKKIREAGCWIMEVGIESGSDRILKLIKKNTTKAEIASAVTTAKKAGIKIKGNFIFGLPTETKESLEETIEFAKSIDIHLFQQTYMTILPGCELSFDAEKYGTYESEWDKITMYKVNFVPFGLTKQDLTDASKKAFRAFYLRPKTILRIGIHSFTSFRAFKSSVLALIAFTKTLLRKPNKPTAT